jgi:predicted protein tyrosine phosphatase
MTIFFTPPLSTSKHGFKSTLFMMNQQEKKRLLKKYKEYVKVLS